MTFTFGIILGVFLGVALGVFVMSAMALCKRADERG